MLGGKKRSISCGFARGSSPLLVLEVFEGFQYGFFEGDALIGVGVIGCEMNCGDVGCAGFVKGGDEGVVGGREPVV